MLDYCYYPNLHQGKQLSQLLSTGHPSFLAQGRLPILMIALNEYFEDSCSILVLSKVMLKFTISKEECLQAQKEAFAADVLSHLDEHYI